MHNMSLLSLSRSNMLIALLLCLIMPVQAQLLAMEPNDSVRFEGVTLDGRTLQIGANPPKSTSDAADPNAPQLTVVCFMGTECPLARLYAPRLLGLSNKFADQRLQVVAVFSNQQDSLKEVTDFSKQFGPNVSVIKDDDNRIADLFQAERTPEAFLLDREARVVYRGRIDDQFAPGISKGKVQRADLQIAIEEAIAGKPISQPRQKVFGCLIGRVKKPVADAEVTYSSHIAAILQRNCVECHRAGEIGPQAFTDYDEIIGWSETILEVVEQGRMPPWHASPEHGEFINERRMSDEEKELLRKWVAAGSPLGDRSAVQPIAPQTSGWQLPHEPDLVVEMANKPYRVPGEGEVPYQYFVVDPKLTEDRWISAAQVIPGNRSVVHHCIVFVRPPDGSEFRGIGWLTAYVPGQRVMPLPPGAARKVPAGSKFVFQMHYTTNGTEAEDITKVGVTYIPDSEVTHQIYTLAALDQDFEIPPGAKHHKVKATLRELPANAELLAVAPHMHLRGKSFELSAVDRKAKEANSDAQPQTLLQVPSYDFNWQHTYIFKRPLPFSELREVYFEAGFDNSTENPFNPDPNEYVGWGDQTWEEMAVAFFEVSEPLPGKSDKQRSTESADVANSKSPNTESVKSKEVEEFDKKVDEFVNDFFADFQSSEDRIVLPSETPLAFQNFSFYQFDGNGDGRITEEEVREVGKAKATRPMRTQRRR